MAEKTINDSNGRVKISKEEMTREEKYHQVRKSLREFKLRNSIIKDVDEHGNPGMICLIPLITLTASLFFFLKHLIFDEKAIENRVYLYWFYQKPGVSVLLWMTMIGSVFFLFFPAFCLWANLRKSIPKTGFKDYLFLTLYIAYIVGLYIIYGHCICLYDLGPIASVFIGFEQIRLTMKVHSFVRENAAKVLKCEKAAKGESKVETIWQPDFGKFLYYIFAPTVIYCDHYPRTGNIIWRRFFYFLFAFFSCTVMYTTSCMILARIYGRDFMECPFLSYKKFVYLTVIIITANPTVLAGLAYGFWHCYNNAWAEIMRFGDRQFYGDYWNGTDFKEFMSRWAVPLHVWFQLYVYMDLDKIFPMKRKYKLLVTMLVSSLMHDYMVFAIGKLFFPIYLWVLFIFATLFPQALVAKMEKSSLAVVWLVTTFFQLFGGYAFHLRMLYGENIIFYVPKTILRSISTLLFGY